MDCEKAEPGRGEVYLRNGEIQLDWHAVESGGIEGIRILGRVMTGTV